MTLREYYTNEFPGDELGQEINPTGTFSGLLLRVFTGQSVYDYIGVEDSIVRERLFEKLAEDAHTDYQSIYYTWLNL